jgi:hypothetical protein
MPSPKKRVTVYIQPEIHRALRIKSAETEYSVSDLINEAIKQALAEDAIDLAAFEERKNEPESTFASVVKELQKHGRL